MAGLAFAEVALRHGRSLKVIDNGSQNASSVAAGLYNPVAIKRMKAIPDADSLLSGMNEFYVNGQHSAFRHPLRLLRRFHSFEEQNQWFEAADTPNLAKFVVPHIQAPDINGMAAPYGFGEISQAGYVDTSGFISSYRDYLAGLAVFQATAMDYGQISIGGTSCTYAGEEFGRIVFAEGFGLHGNPFFNYLPLNGTKGEILLIRAEELQLDCIVNAGIFILPLGNHLFRVGATYEHLDKSNQPTKEGRQELESKLKELIQVPYEVIGHQAGVRPTVRDRQPLLGRHAQYGRLAVLNGLGTRGVLFAPTLAKCLFDHLENDKPLPGQWDIKRFRRDFSRNG